MIELVSSSNVGEADIAHISDGRGDDDADTFHHSFNPNTRSVVDEIVAATATIKNVHETALDPLQESVDTDALERLVDGQASRPGDVEVQFHFEEFRITVSARGDVWLEWA